MIFDLSFIFIITFAGASKNAINSKKSDMCTPILSNEFEYEKFVFSIIDDTNTVSLKCMKFDAVGSIQIPSVVVRSDLSINQSNKNNSPNFTVVKIQSGCFRNQLRMTSISMPETVTDIGQFAFFDCAELSSFRYPTKITYVSQSCFYGCINLESIILPPETITIEAYSFNRCELLRYIQLPSSVQSIGQHAFSYCRCVANTFDIPNSVDCIEQYSFSNCILIETIRIGNVKRISSHAFYNCTSLTKIIIDTDQIKNHRNAIQNVSPNTFIQDIKIDILNPNNQKRIVFDHTSQKRKTSLKSLQIIEEYAFSYTSIHRFEYIFENLYYIGEGAFMQCVKLDTINLTSKVFCICSNCFLNCTSLSQIILPPSLEIIENSAFKSCSSLQKIELPDTVTEIGDFAFMQCSRLNEINFPQELLKIGQSSFALCSDISIPSIFPPKLKSIGSYAFASCLIKAEKIKLPPNIEKIGNNPFKMSSIEAIEVPINNSFLISYQNVLYSAFSSDGQIKNSKKRIIQKDTVHHEPKTLEEAFAIYYPDVPFANIDKKTISFAIYSTCEKVEILEGTTKIGIDTFYNAISLQEIVFPQSVIYIDAGAFVSASLRNITLPPKLLRIGGEAFENCMELKGKVCIPSLVNSIGSCAFSCTGVEEFDVSEDNHFYYAQMGCLYDFQRRTLIQYPNGNISRKTFVIPQDTSIIGHSCFFQNRHIEEITFPSTLTRVEDKAFTSMYSLQVIKINENLNSIGRLAFSQITTLSSISFPASLQFIGDGAFLDTPLEYIEFTSCSVNICNNAFDFSSLICVILPLECNGSKIWSYFPPDKINNSDCFITNTPSLTPTSGDHPFKLPFSITVLVLIIASFIFIIAIICISFFVFKNKKKKEKMKNPNIIESWIIGDPNSPSIDYYTQNRK